MNLIDKILDKIEDLQTLRICTLIGDVKLDETGKKLTFPEEGPKIVTQIDLLTGDITTVFNEDFLEPPLDKIRDYHAEREKQSNEIIRSNIKALMELIDLFKKAYDIKKEVNSDE